VAPVAVGQAAVRALSPALLRAGVRAYGLYGRGVVLVVVHTTPLFMIYRLDRSPGAPPPDAPLIDFDQ